MRRPTTHQLLSISSAVTSIVALSACTLVGPDQTSGQNPQATSERVVVVTHDAWALPKDLMLQWEADTGYDLVVRRSGDVGTLTNKLVLTKANPAADVVYGIDNTFASRALAEQLIAESNLSVPSDVEPYALPEGTGRLIPIDSANVCVNIDAAWFARQGIPEPTSLADLAKPRYRDLFVTPAPSTSSPGLAFLLATIAEFGADWPSYWQRLVENGVKTTSGWSDAYFVDYTAGGGGGDRPIVVSYDSSPAFTLTKDGSASTTKALLDTCLQQVEYAGVLAEADNPEGAAEFVQWLLSPAVQEQLPNSMFVFPVLDAVALPPAWAKFAPRPSAPKVADPEAIERNRDEWLSTWTDLSSG